MATLGDYADKYTGQRFVVLGKGRTTFDYHNLSAVTSPICFVNDAIQFAPLATRSVERFFIAHDRKQAIWLTAGLGFTAVMLGGRPKKLWNRDDTHPVWKRLFADELPATMRDAQPIVTFRWGGRHQWPLLKLSRAALVADGRLFACGATIHTALHFAWLAGAASIAFIGCDANDDGYDSRIRIRSQTPDLQQHKRIQRVADYQCRELGLATEYITSAAMPAT